MASLGFFLGLLASPTYTFAQFTSSTYSSLGVGIFNNSGLTQNQGMGGMGVSFGNSYSVNHVNPAISVKNAAYSFQAAFNYNQLSATTTSNSEVLDGGGLSYVAMSFPVVPRKFTVGLGLNQLTGVDYNITVNTPVNNTDLVSQNMIEGKGGLSQVYLQSGFQVYKTLSLGVEGAYTFGSTIRTNQLDLLDEEMNGIGISSEYYERLTFSDVTFKGSIYYAQQLGEQKYLNLGAIYHVFGDINGKEFAKMGESGQASIPNSPGDVIADDVSGSIFLPNKIGYGVTYEKINKFAIGVEAQFQDFSDYRGFNATQTNLGNSYKLSLGGQYIPDAFSLESMLSRSTFRAGIEYERLPYLLNQNQIDDIGINFGASLPVYSLSLLNLAVKLGTRGTVNDGLVRENYIKVSLGISINDNSWFYKKVFE
ncbi:Long-chain fatty acid transport protein [Cyclobacterium lianum]|uniref:Long-chain fatty acid transport protein n=1 Tax=Cyclobacterium lianum TaxID=388280 RepID=A0A1M7K6K0_9BACT|nr:Long-chain fatty acid transport protein [Cyclobacterium lianum]